LEAEENGHSREITEAALAQSIRKPFHEA